MPTQGNPSRRPTETAAAQPSGVGTPLDVLPGPWWVQQNGAEYEICANYPGRPDDYAVLMSTDTPDILPGSWFDGKGIAQLAAASLDLYEALEELVAHGLDEDQLAYLIEQSTVRKARAALAKARG